MLSIRTARPQDKAAITALAAKIWEGEDYLHHNFDNWVAQERGRFIVAYEEENLVGCGKLTEFLPGEWWMEGLRVDPDWRGRGIARLIHENIIRIANEIASSEQQTGSLRFATDSENYPIHKLALDTGFSHINKHFLYRTDIPTDLLTIKMLPFITVHPSEKSQIEAWFGRSAYFAAANGLFEDTWKWYEILPRLEDLLENGRLHWWRKTNNGADGLIIIHHRDPETMVLNYLDTPTNRWAELMDDTRLLAQTLNIHQIKSKPLAAPEIQQALPNTDWEIEYNLEMWVFQRPIG